jgi:nuclear transport factor 2 (NTF2) superfamily protein
MLLKLLNVMKKVNDYKLKKEWWVFLKKNRIASEIDYTVSTVL